VKIVNGTFMKNGKLNDFYVNQGAKLISNGIIKIRLAIYDDIDPKILVFDNYHESKHRDIDVSGLDM
jgi:hypothetical protein